MTLVRLVLGVVIVAGALAMWRGHRWGAIVTALGGIAALLL